MKKVVAKNEQELEACRQRLVAAIPPYAGSQGTGEIAFREKNRNRYEAKQVC